MVFYSCTLLFNVSYNKVLARWSKRFTILNAISDTPQYSDRKYAKNTKGMDRN